VERTPVRWTPRRAISLGLVILGGLAGILAGTVLGFSHTAATRVMESVSIGVGTVGWVAGVWVLRTPRSAGHMMLVVGGLWIAAAIAALVLRPDGLSWGFSGFVLAGVLAMAGALVLLGAACALAEGRRSEPAQIDEARREHRLRSSRRRMR